jgi:hypothetical protein
VGVCNQVTFLVLNYIASRLVPLLKVIDAPIQVPNVVNLAGSFQFLFCMTKSRNSLIVAIKSKGKYRIHAASILMFHTLHITYLTEAVLRQWLHIFL